MDTHPRPIFFSVSFPYVKGVFYDNVFEVVTFPLSILFLLLSAVSPVRLASISTRCHLWNFHRLKAWLLVSGVFWNCEPITLPDFSFFTMTCFYGLVLFVSNHYNR